MRERPIILRSLLIVATPYLDSSPHTRQYNFENAASFAKETYNFKEPTNRSHRIDRFIATHTPIRSRKCSLSLSLSRKHARTHTYVCAQKHTHIHTNIHACTLAHTHTHAHTCTHMRAHTHTHAHTCTHTHVHTHTQ